MHVFLNSVEKKEPLNQAIPIEQVNEPESDPGTELDISTNGLAPGQIIQLIQQLPEGYRSIFNLYAIEGYNHQEISEILKISAGTSRSQYARARKLLAQQISNLKVGCYE